MRLGLSLVLWGKERSCTLHILFLVCYLPYKYSSYTTDSQYILTQYVYLLLTWLAQCYLLPVSSIMPPPLQSTAFVSFKLTTKGCRSSSWWVEMMKNGWTRWHRDKLKVDFARDIIIIIKCLADRLERSCLPTARNFQQHVSINVVTHLYAMTNGSLEFLFPVFLCPSFCGSVQLSLHVRSCGSVLSFHNWTRNLSKSFHNWTRWLSLYVICDS